MKNQIAIVLKQAEDGYVFEEVTEVIPDDNQIHVSNIDYNNLASGTYVNIKTENFKPDKKAYLVFDADVLIKAAKTGDVSHNDAKKKVTENLTKIGQNLETVRITTAGNMASVDLQSKTKTKKYEQVDLKSINPNELIGKIKEKVIGQDKAVETIVRNIYNNQLVLNTGQKNLISTQKTHIFFDGPTGTGKTLIMNEVAENLHLPIIIRAATTFTTTGYRGVELQQMLVSLLDETGGDLEAAEKGIIVLDEFDKLGNANKEKSLEIKEAVQQDLLTYLSGGKFNIEYNGKQIEFDTSRLTFIGLGAFTDMREKKEENLDENGHYTVKPEDYINAGIMREVIGRFNLITSTKALNKDDYIRILKESSISPLNNMVETLKTVYNADVVYDENIVDAIAEAACKENTGARSLETVVHGVNDQLIAILQKSMFENTETTQIAITQEMIDNIEKQAIREVGPARKAA